MIIHRTRSRLNDEDVLIAHAHAHVHGELVVGEALEGDKTGSDAQACSLGVDQCIIDMEWASVDGIYPAVNDGD